MIRRNNSILKLVVFLIVGAIVGGVIADFTKGALYFEWLSFGKEFGISTDQPLLIDFGIIKLKFGFMLNITVAGLLGIISAIFVYRKI